MRIRNCNRNGDERPSLQMSSMIDVVFLLLIFFVMTFQVTAAEGDLEINAAPSVAQVASDVPPRRQLFHVHLRAATDGSLSTIQIDGRGLDTIKELAALLQLVVADRTGDDYAVQLHVAQNLLYQHTMDAITAIRGKNIDAPLIKDIRFSRAD